MTTSSFSLALWNDRKFKCAERYRFFSSMSSRTRTGTAATAPTSCSDEDTPASKSVCVGDPSGRSTDFAARCIRISMTALLIASAVSNPTAVEFPQPAATVAFFNHLFGRLFQTPAVTRHRRDKLDELGYVTHRTVNQASYATVVTGQLLVSTVRQKRVEG